MQARLTSHSPGELLAEWDEGRGTSQSEIERRVWGGGGAHGRRFDRLIRQTLGVSTNRPSKQTDRIATLLSQLRRMGVAPQGVEPTEWEAQLQHGRHAAIAAIPAWNDPMASFRTESFALHIVTAWNSLAIAVLQHSGSEWWVLNDTGGPELIDGREKAKETSELLVWPGPAAGTTVSGVTSSSGSDSETTSLTGTCQSSTRPSYLRRTQGC